MLLVGSGAREHALAWRLANSPSLTTLHAAPGNPGIAGFAECHPVRADDVDGIRRPRARSVGRSRRRRAGGAARRGRRGPAAQRGRAGVRPERRGGTDRGLEGVREGGHGRRRRADRRDASGRAAAVRREGRRPRSGEGRLRVPHRRRGRGGAARGGRVRRRRSSSRSCSKAPEVSLFALCDGRRAIPLGAAQDFKRAFDGDEGPNTGGMGAYSPVPGLPDVADLVHRIHQPVLDELSRRGTPFVGCLFAGRDADGLRPARAGVQRALRRPRDAGAAAAPARPTCSPRWPWRPPET